MCADAAISDIAMRQKIFWEIFSHRRFLSEHPVGDSIEGTGPEEGWVSIKISGKVQFSRCAERGVWKMGFQFVFPFFFFLR